MVYTNENILANFILFLRVFLNIIRFLQKIFSPNTCLCRLVYIINRFQKYLFTSNTSQQKNDFTYLFATFLEYNKVDIKNISVFLYDMRSSFPHFR